MITELEFKCGICGDGLSCKITIPIDLQAGVPVFTPNRCVMSSAMDNECKFILTKESQLVES